MNIGFWSCIILVIPFVIIGVLFAIFKEKATKFVSGFNSFSKEDINNSAFYYSVNMLRHLLKMNLITEDEYNRIVRISSEYYSTKIYCV